MIRWWYDLVHSCLIYVLVMHLGLLESNLWRTIHWGVPLAPHRIETYFTDSFLSIEHSFEKMHPGAEPTVYTAGQVGPGRALSIEAMGAQMRESLRTDSGCVPQKTAPPWMWTSDTFTSWTLLWDAAKWHKGGMCGMECGCLIWVTGCLRMRKPHHGNPTLLKQTTLSALAHPLPLKKALPAVIRLLGLGGVDLCVYCMYLWMCVSSVYFLCVVSVCKHVCLYVSLYVHHLGVCLSFYVRSVYVLCLNALLCVHSGSMFVCCSVWCVYLCLCVLSVYISMCKCVYISFATVCSRVYLYVCIWVYICVFLCVWFVCVSLYFSF